MINEKIDMASKFYNLDTFIDINDMINEMLTNNKNHINFYWLGTQPYNSIWELQKKIHALRVNNKIGDVVLLLEHNHVYTLGKNANENHILPSRPKDADIIRIDRGGDVTYHGPGQLVGYPIMDLHDYKMSITWYMKFLSDVIVDLLAELDIDSNYKSDYIGVWVEDDKIAAFGVRLAKWVTMHGFALNISTDLDYFRGMIPCGIFECGVTSINEISTNKLSVDQIARLYSKYFLKNLKRNLSNEITQF